MEDYGDYKESYDKIKPMCRTPLDPGFFNTMKKRKMLDDDDIDDPSLLALFFPSPDVMSWRTRMRQNEFVNMLYDFIDRVDRRYSRSLLDSNMIFFLSTIIPRRPEIEVKKILNWEDAEMSGQLKEYFKGRDSFGLFSNEDLNLKDLTEEYMDYVRNRYPKREIARYYMNYLKWRAVSVQLRDNTYSAPETFYRLMSRQVAEYMFYLSQTHGRVIIPGDGPGTASIACILLDRDYVSMEPNGIGDFARHLGIITGNQTIDDMEERDGLHFVAQLGDMGLDYLMRYPDSSYILIDESRVYLDRYPIETTDARVFSSEKIRGLREAVIPTMLYYLRNKEPLRPVDKATENYVRSLGLEVASKGQLVSMDTRGVNVFTGANSSNPHRARLGEEKKIRIGMQEVDFKFVGPQTTVISAPGFVSGYHPMEVGGGDTAPIGTWLRLKSGVIQHVSRNPEKIRKIQDFQFTYRVKFITKVYDPQIKNWIAYYAQAGRNIFRVNISGDFFVGKTRLKYAENVAEMEI